MNLSQNQNYKNVFEQMQKAMKEGNIASLEPCSLQKGRLLHGYYFCLNGQLSQLKFQS